LLSVAKLPPLKVSLPPVTLSYGSDIVFALALSFLFRQGTRRAETVLSLFLLS